MDTTDIEGDLTEVLFTQEQIHARIAELCREIEADYEGRDLLIVGVLKGAVMVMADLARELKRDVEMDWMATSSYGTSTESSGVVRIIKDLDTDIADRHVLIIEDIVDSGLTLSWQPCIPRGLRSVAQTRSRESRHRGALRGLRHPQLVRRRLRARLRGALPQPALDRHPRPARLQLSWAIAR
jgi:hypothetical protein